jgi:predicted PurR-regulated permease PerM
MAPRPAGVAAPPRRAWPSRDVLRVAGLLAGVYLALKLLWAASAILLLTFLGVLLGLALSAGVDRLQRLRVPRAVGTVAIVLTILSLLIGLGRLVAPTLSTQWRQVTRQLPEVVERARGWLSAQRGGVVDVLTRGEQPGNAPAGDTGGAPKRGGAAESAPTTPLVNQVVDRFGDIGRRFFSFFSSTLAVLGGVLLVLFVGIYVAVEPKVYHAGLMHLVPHRARPRAREVLGRIGYMLRRWLLTQAIAMTAVGVLTTVVLMLLDVQGALALGLLAGLLEFVPIAGPIISSVPAIGMGFIDGPEKALYVTFAFIGIQQVEAQLITPLLMKERLELPPALTIVGQAVMSIVFGFIGLIVAVPLLGAALVAVKMMYVRDVVGDPVPIPGDAAS